MGISNLFSGRRNNLRQLILDKNLSSRERTALRSYMSTRIARVLDKALRHKFGNIKRTARKVELSQNQISEMAFLLAGIPGVGSKQVISYLQKQSGRILDLRTDEHFQLSAISFLSKYVFVENPKLSAKEYISTFLSELRKANPKEKGAYEKFYESLSSKSQPEKKTFVKITWYDWS